LTSALLFRILFLKSRHIPRVWQEGEIETDRLWTPGSTHQILDHPYFTRTRHFYCLYNFIIYGDFVAVRVLECFLCPKNRELEKYVWNL
jgi:hypothetical protein